MPTLNTLLDLTRCPHCNVDRPTLTAVGNALTSSYTNDVTRVWRFYACARCGGVVTAAAQANGGIVTQMYPASLTVSENVPQAARDYLDQALSTLHAPAGSVMLSASSVDAMLKAKDYKEGSLYSRINQAATDHLITQGMATWAHQVRLDANDQRHADKKAALPTEQDARKSVDFALALAEFLFVLPARVNQGLKEATPSTS